MSVLSSKDPVEKVVVTFDYTPALFGSEVCVKVESVTVEVVAGVDPNPEAILNGEPKITDDGFYVQLPVQGGLDNVNYNIKCLCQTSNPDKLINVSGILPVRKE